MFSSEWFLFFLVSSDFVELFFQCYVCFSLFGVVLSFVVLQCFRDSLGLKDVFFLHW